PIIIAALIFGYKSGLVFAVIGGLLLGPLMPIDTLNGVMQQPLNWIYRMLFFMIIAFITGQFSSQTNKFYLEKLRQATYVNGTNIYKIDVLKDDLAHIPKEQIRRFLILKLRIINRVDLQDFFGISTYYTLLETIKNKLDTKLPKKIGIYARSLEGLILCFHEDEVDNYLSIIQNTMNEPCVIDNVPILVQTVIGLAYLNPNDFEETFTRASLASSFADDAQRSFVFYSETIGNKQKELHLLGRISEAIKNDEFYLLYQPKIDLKTNKVVGAECLIRWDHPEFGLVAPNTFIPLVEKTSLINSLTEWIVINVLKHIHKHKDQFNSSEHPIAINISTANLSEKSALTENILGAIDSYELNEYAFQFEITESLLMANPEESIEVINYLSKSGIHFSIDDFGTGYSSLSYLTRLNVHELKIDHAFVSNMFNTTSDYNVVKSTIELAQSLGIITVAEGVETEKQAQSLLALGCNIAQGYYSAKPMTFAKLIDYINQKTNQTKV
ncbi:MAG: putative bifunctional diguanylate cyclase/phosphodiesterase, partial [Candidatus Izemoplasmataceae bacterium]